MSRSRTQDSSRRSCADASPLAASRKLAVVGNRSRFAPSTTGRAHPGTLLAALLCWLDARSRGGEVLLRLEDLDQERTKPGFVESMLEDLSWFGLDWDGVSRQSEHRARYEAKLDELTAVGRVYGCLCSRRQIREDAARAPDGSFRYSGACRERIVAPQAWRALDLPLRLRISEGEVAIRDESGLDLSGDSERLFGDPIVRRRDGAFAYHFSSVLDDEAASIDRIVRGRDLAPSTTLQAGLRSLLGFSIPMYRHHALLLETQGEKLSKLHGAVDMRALGARYDAAALCGCLAHFVGLVPLGTRCQPGDLVDEFDWGRVRSSDIVLAWSAEAGLREINSR